MSATRPAIDQIYSARDVAGPICDTRTPAQREYEHRLAGLRETLQARKENTRRAEEELKLAEEIQKAAQDEYDDAVDERQEGI